MNPFELYNPTRIHFGTQSFSKIAQEIPPGSRVLLTYGQGSILRTGILEKVVRELKDIFYVEFGGIEPNPTLQTLSKGLEIIKEKQIDYLLAVGGGSVIDGTKFMAAAACHSGNPWEILKNKHRITHALPMSVVLTMPATGSENNSGAVITNSETREKLGMGGPALFPKVAFLNPEVIRTIPKEQLRNGIIDAFVHVLEQYVTYPNGAILQDRFSESILSSLIELAPRILHEPFHESVASNYMWCCSMALNGLIQKGVPTDWSTHMIGHELTALFHIDHAMTLAIVLPHLWKYKLEEKREKLAQYAERVWGIKEGNIHEKAIRAIEKTTEFFHSVGAKTKLSEYTSNYFDSADIIRETFISRGWMSLGENSSITPDDVLGIVKSCY